MQKLQGKLKNTPRDTSLVPCSVNSQLNRVEKLSVEDKVRTCNNPEGNLRQHRGASDLRVLNIVYVLLIPSWLFLVEVQRSLKTSTFFKPLYGGQQFLPRLKSWVSLLCEIS